MIQLAMLDTAGASRGADDSDLALLHQVWTNVSVTAFSSASDAGAWVVKLPADGDRPVVRVLYNKPTGELRVFGRWKGKSFARSFAVEQDLATAVNQAKVFVQQQTQR